MRRNAVIIVLSFLSSAVFLALAFRRLDFGGIVRALGQASLWPWLPLAVASYLTGHVVRGMRCRRLVSRETALSLPMATNVVVLGYAVNNILPLRMGELARAGVLAERTGLPLVQTLTVTMLERVLDGAVLVMLLIGVLWLGMDGNWMLGSLALAVAFFSMLSLAIVLAVTCPNLGLSLASRVSSRLAPGLHDRALAATSAVINGVAYLRRPQDAAGIVVLSVIVWLFEAGMFLLLLPAFGIAARPSYALLAMTVTNLGILIPSSPGFIGPFHYFCMRSLTSQGIPVETALSYAVLVHLAFFVPITVWGVAIFMGYGLVLSKVMGLRGQARPLNINLGEFTGMPAKEVARRPAGPGERPSSRFLRALVESLVPPYPSHSGLKPAADVVAEFVQGELNALPARLRFMFAVGMLGFQSVTLLYFWKPFASIPLEARQRWVEHWAYGRVSLARQLFRGVRSIALLAYFELPGALPGSSG